jgi:hypothetical protein
MKKIQVSFIILTFFSCFTFAQFYFYEEKSKLNEKLLLEYLDSNGVAISYYTSKRFDFELDIPILSFFSLTNDTLHGTYLEISLETGEIITHADIKYGLLWNLYIFNKRSDFGDFHNGTGYVDHKVFRLNPNHNFRNYVLYDKYDIERVYYDQGKFTGFIEFFNQEGQLQYIVNKKLDENESYVYNRDSIYYHLNFEEMNDSNMILFERYSLYSSFHYDTVIPVSKDYIIFGVGSREQSFRFQYFQPRDFYLYEKYNTRKNRRNLKTVIKALTPIYEKHGFTYLYFQELNKQLTK